MKIFGLVILFNSSPIFLHEFNCQTRIIQNTGIWIYATPEIRDFRSIACFKAAIAGMEDVLGEKAAVAYAFISCIHGWFYKHLLP